MTSKENSNWQTIYEKLQEIADAFAEYKWYSWINIEEDRVEFKPTWWYEMITMSYHDLFSKDSGLMEFMEWKPLTLQELSYHQMRSDSLDYRYMKMSTMTAEEKCNYFVNNAIIPTPLSEFLF